ncbi:MAG: arylsulfatase [Bacteroidales bacterium]
MPNKNNFSVRAGFILTGLAALSYLSGQTAERPNVILIVTDDQGYGDLSFTGNPHVKTPVLDNLARRSIRFNNFYVCPVSAPTRASLMTGRYSLRTGVRDTYNGGAMMASSEVTIAEILKTAGYVTGHFGKWHLGDNYPMRPTDQGFDESVMHLAGGMGQPGDFTTWPRRDSSYFDPVLWHNGKQQKYYGYCSDIFTSAAIDFIKKNHKRPFFCYLAFNAPHTPLQVPEKYYNLYRGTDPSAGFGDNQAFLPQMSEKDKEDARRVYAMVTNIDDNIGRLLKTLEELKLTEKTIVIFMSDNGPQQRRYNAGMRGLKSSVYRGGVRVPFWIKYTGLRKDGVDVNITASAIDVLPTISALCNTSLPAGVKIDGINLLPLIKGEKSPEERALFFYWTRHSPELYTNIALQKGRYRLIGNTDYNADISKFELYNIEQDPYETVNIINENSALALKLKKEFDTLFSELIKSENLLERPRIEIGTAFDNAVILNRNDADGQWGIWEQNEIHGFWRVMIYEGRYNIRFKFFEPVPAGGKMMIETGSFITQSKDNSGNSDVIEMKNVYFPALKCDFTPFYLTGGRRIFPFYVEIEKISD